MRPQPRVQIVKKHTSIVTTVTPETPGIPRAMVLTGSFVLSPVIGLSCHRHQRNCFHQLDAGVEASGPHDFAVRLRRLRQRAISVHRIPSYVRDDRETPLERDGMIRFIAVSTQPSREISENQKSDRHGAGIVSSLTTTGHPVAAPSARKDSDRMGTLTSANWHKAGISTVPMDVRHWEQSRPCNCRG
jgi:hypothetical protein